MSHFETVDHELAVENHEGDLVKKQVFALVTEGAQAHARQLSREEAELWHRVNNAKVEQQAARAVETEAEGDAEPGKPSAEVKAASACMGEVSEEAKAETEGGADIGKPSVKAV